MYALPIGTSAGFGSLFILFYFIVKSVFGTKGHAAVLALGTLLFGTGGALAGIAIDANLIKKEEKKEKVRVVERIMYRDRVEPSLQEQATLRPGETVMTAIGPVSGCSDFVIGTEMRGPDFNFEKQETGY